MRQTLWTGAPDAPDRPTADELVELHSREDGTPRFTAAQVHERPSDTAGSVDLYYEGPEHTE